MIRSYLIEIHANCQHHPKKMVGVCVRWPRFRKLPRYQLRNVDKLSSSPDSAYKVTYPRKDLVLSSAILHAIRCIEARTDSRCGLLISNLVVVGLGMRCYLATILGTAEVR